MGPQASTPQRRLCVAPTLGRISGLNGFIRFRKAISTAMSDKSQMGAPTCLPTRLEPTWLLMQCVCPNMATPHRIAARRRRRHAPAACRELGRWRRASHARAPGPPDPPIWRRRMCARWRQRNAMTTRRASRLLGWHADAFRRHVRHKVCTSRTHTLRTKCLRRNT